MEVSGKTKAQNTFSASRGSAEDFELFCIPCDTDGTRLPAYGYCKNCEEHLCETCFKHHRKSTPSRNHILLGKDSMPTTPSVSNSPDDFNSCHEHVDKKQKFYCKDHSTTLCTICVTLEHRVCKVKYIPKLSKDIQRGNKLQELMADIEALEDVCKSRIKKAKENIKNTAQNRVQVLKEITKFRKELNTYLDEMELSVTKEAESLITTQQESIERLSSDLEGLIKEIEVSKVRLDSFLQRNQLDTLFLEMKNAEEQLIQITAKERQTTQIQELQKLEFVKNQAIVEMLQSQNQLGRVIPVVTPKRSKEINVVRSVTPSEDKTVVLEYVGEINVKSASDGKENDITGIEVIQPDRIVVCDISNKKVKCYNTKQNKMVSEIQLSKWPRDVTAVRNNTLAVTVPDKKCVYIMSLTNTSIATDRRMNVNEECHGIAYSQDKLVISCYVHPGKVLIVDLNGKIHRSFCADGLLSWPSYTAVNTAGTYIYVSDNGYKAPAVKQLDWQGNVVNTYPATYLQGIHELDDRTFLVSRCITGKDNIIRISSSCKSCRVTGQEDLGDWYPKAVAYCKQTRRLYVSYSENGMLGPKNFIKVFKVSLC